MPWRLRSNRPIYLTLCLFGDGERVRDGLFHRIFLQRGGGEEEQVEFFLCSSPYFLAPEYKAVTYESTQQHAELIIPQNIITCGPAETSISQTVQTAWKEAIKIRFTAQAA